MEERHRPASGLKVSPLRVYNEKRVRARVFLCMLARHVERSTRAKPAPILFGDDDREAARARRPTPVERAEVSESAEAKAAAKQAPDGMPVHSFRTLLAGLGTVTMNWMVLSTESNHEIPVPAERAPLQRRASELLGADPQKMLPR